MKELDGVLAWTFTTFSLFRPGFDLLGGSRCVAVNALLDLVERLLLDVRGDSSILAPMPFISWSVDGMSALV